MSGLRRRTKTRQSITGTNCRVIVAPPHRLCDGALGLEQWPDSSDQQGDTCLPCREVYLTDLRYGHRALRFIEEPPSQEERDTKQRKLRNYHTAKQPAVFVTRGPKSVIETGEISAAEL